MGVLTTFAGVYLLTSNRKDEDSDEVKASKAGRRVRECVRVLTCACVRECVRVLPCAPVRACVRVLPCAPVREYV